MKVVFIDTVHACLQEYLEAKGVDCIDLTNLPKAELAQASSDAEGVVIRSKIPMNREFFDACPKLKFIARSGAGMENIDVPEALKRGIQLFNAPEGNRQAVGEHALGMLLALFNRIVQGDTEIHNGIWQREANRGIELQGKTVGIIGYGNNGSAFAQVLKGFGVNTIAYDKYKDGFGSAYVKEVGLEEILGQSDVISLHIPQTEETIGLVNDLFIEQAGKPFYLINLSRGKTVSIESLVKGLESGKVLGACLDVLEYESSSFQDVFTAGGNTLKKLLAFKNVLVSPHVGGWTHESYYKLSKVLADKIEASGLLEVKEIS